MVNMMKIKCFAFANSHSLIFIKKFHDNKDLNVFYLIFLNMLNFKHHNKKNICMISAELNKKTFDFIRDTWLSNRNLALFLFLKNAKNISFPNNEYDLCKENFEIILRKNIFKFDK